MMRFVFCVVLVVVFLIGCCPPFCFKPGGFTFNGGVPTQSGEPTGLNQQTLVIFTRASDNTTANLAALRTGEQAEFNDVSSFYFDEASFGQLSFDYTFAPATGWYQMPNTYDYYMENNLLEGNKWVEFMEAAMQDALDDGFSVANMDHVIVVIVGPFHRGQSAGTWTYTLEDSQGDDFQVNIECIVVSTHMGWSRTAHEFGHGFASLPDLYGAPNRGIGKWDIMDCTDCGAQPTSFQKDHYSQWFSNAQVKTLTRPTGINQITDVTNLRAYETGNPSSTDIQSLKLELGGELKLYVENRQELAGQAGSQDLPSNGGVIITDVTDNTSNFNASRPPILLYGGPLHSGDVFTDQAYGDLKIEVNGTAPDLTVTTTWGPDPFFDLSINPWNPPPWESRDIWIDSEDNGWDVYEYSNAVQNPGIPGNPIRNGDRPWVGKTNRVYARVHNTGNAAANNIKVSFFITTPQGIGDTGDWTLLGSQTIAQLSGNSSNTVYVNWRPSTSGHSCIIAKIDHQIGELNANNNEAQENVGDFNTTASSPWKEYKSTVRVGNPTDQPQWIHMEITNLPRGWTGWIKDREFRLEPKKNKLVSYKIDPGRGGDLKTGVSVDVNVEGWLLRGDQEVRYGGVTTAMHMVEKSKIEIRVPKYGDMTVPSEFIVSATITPKAINIPVTLEIIKPNNDKYSLMHGKTDAQGMVSFRVGDMAMDRKIMELETDSVYAIQAHIIGNNRLDKASSAKRTVLIKK